jgi:integrase
MNSPGADQLSRWRRHIRREGWSSSAITGDRMGATASARDYRRLLHDPALTNREAAILWLLAHGLKVAEIARLKTEDVHTDEGYVIVGEPPRLRVVPLSPSAIATLGPWVRNRIALGRTYLLHPTGRHISAYRDPLSARTVRHIVQKAARRVFAGRPDIQALVHPAGFRELLVRQALKRPISLPALAAITGMAPTTLVNRAMAMPAGWGHIEREFKRLTRGRGGWL